MDKYDFSQILSPEAKYSIDKILYQRWYAQSYSYLTSARPHHGILLVVDGKIDFISKGETLTAAGSDLIFLPEGCNYKARIRQEYGITYDYLLSFDIAEAKFQNLPEHPVKILTAADGRYLDLFSDILAAKADKLHPLKALGNFYLLLDLIISDCRLGDNRKNPLSKALELLSYDSGLSIEQISKQCNISDSGFRKKFTETYGVSPVKYRTQLKINRAKYLLQSTDMSVSEISNQLMFYDEAYFCKVFKGYTNMTPREYAKSKQL